MTIYIPVSYATASGMYPERETYEGDIHYRKTVEFLKTYWDNGPAVFAHRHPIEFHQYSPKNWVSDVASIIPIDALEGENFRELLLEFDLRNTGMFVIGPNAFSPLKMDDDISDCKLIIPGEMFEDMRDYEAGDTDKNTMVWVPFRLMDVLEDKSKME